MLVSRFMSRLVHCSLWLTLAASTVVGMTMVAPAHGQRPVAKQIEPGVSFYETTQPTAVKSRTTLWVYLPSGIKNKLPCVIIAAAGTPLIWGMSLGDGDRPEHLPYVHAGFAVVAYSIDGAVPESPSNEQVLAGYNAFHNAHAGVSDTYAAIDYVCSHLPQVDPKRIYAAGHSSAGTLALLAAESDPRIQACVAYAPVCNVAQHEARLAKLMQPLVPNIIGFLTRTSPITHAAELHCPLFLFHARDDETVPTSDVDAFAQKVTRTNSQVTYSQVSKGGHYESMLTMGVPRAINWLKELH